MHRAKTPVLQDPYWGIWHAVSSPTGSSHYQLVGVAFLFYHYLLVRGNLCKHILKDTEVAELWVARACAHVSAEIFWRNCQILLLLGAIRCVEDFTSWFRRFLANNGDRQSFYAGKHLSFAITLIIWFNSILFSVKKNFKVAAYILFHLGQNLGNCCILLSIYYLIKTLWIGNIPSC